MSRLSIVFVLLLAPWLGAASAQEGEPAGASPRAAMREYLTACRGGDYEAAARYLALSHLPPGRRAEEGPALARRFKAVLDRTLWVELEALSDAPEGDLDDGLAADREQVGEIARAGDAPLPVLLERRAGADPRWRVASATLAAVPALSEELRLDWLEERLPAFWIETRFLELSLWQWLALPALLVLAALFAWIAGALLTAISGALARRTRTRWDEELVRASAAPVRLLLFVAALSAGRALLALPVPGERALEILAGALAVFGFAWLLLRSVDLGAELLRARLEGQGRPGALGLVPLARRTVKVVLMALAALLVVQNLGVNVTGVLAGLGVGGLAIALAAQKTVENFFGGVTLAADQPVRVGDFCRFGDRLGTVEEVGLRSTRVRTLDRTLVTVPNSEFAVMSLENYTKRDRIWFHTVLGLRYETTADQLRHVLAGLRRLLKDDERVATSRVRFIGFGASSLDLEVFSYIATRDFDEFLGIREELLLEIMDCVAASGTGFAFPSHTVYTAKDGGLDEERTRAAIEEARRWREEASAAG